MVLPLLLLAFGLATHDPALSPQMFRAVCAEAAAIWRPYGVRLECASAADRALARPPGLSIVIEGRGDSRARAGAEPLGATPFDADGVAGSTLTIFYDAVLRLVASSEVRERCFGAWPPAARDAFLSRALGRVLAHEIGHYLLGPAHSTGLMRRSFAAQDLVDPSSARFRLTPADIRRVPRADADPELLISSTTSK